MQNQNSELIRRFSSNLKRIRSLKRLSQEELSYRSELNRNYLSDLERGTRNPTLKVIEKVANGLEVDPIELLQ